ncbi:MAG: anaerobic ribonucleoside-triphosphate reductase activating protein [Candidatus Bathyarchaeota archaeon]|nr:MAG: anaerobic ribonucleoside-triphosphate reductase activating protein [Candidatus Bathyarchaeota archaeon]
MRLPQIKGFIPLSSVDWSGKLSTVLFLPYCNFRCPFCHNTNLVLNPDQIETKPYSEIEHYLKRKRDWIDGVVVTGGEPTIHKELASLCGSIMKLGFRVKLDTNGTNPEVVKKLVTKELVDYVALDIKAPLVSRKYSHATGVEDGRLLNRVEKTIGILLGDLVKYEFRTTLVPEIHEEEDVLQICHRIKGCRKYVLQCFKGGVETIDPKFGNITSFSSSKMEEFLELARRTVPNTCLRHTN